MNDQDFLHAISPWITPHEGSLRAHLTLAIRQAVASGQLTDGMRLPPERALAQALNVSRPTISAVVDDLRSSGVVTSRQGSGTWIVAARAERQSTVPFVERLQSTGSIDLAMGAAPDASMLPPMRIETADLLAAEPASGLSPLGLTSLRQAVAEHCALSGSAPSIDQILITSGAHQALGLVVATLAERGSTVLVEDTTYGGLIDMVRANGAVPIGIPRDADGPIPEALEALLSRHEPALVIIVSPVHSPTGRVSPEERTTALQHVLAASSAHVVLDETYADLAFMPTERSVAKGLGERAIRIGSLSKVLWSGLRTGWIIAAEDTCMAIGRRRWTQFDLGPSTAGQLLATQAFEQLEPLMHSRREHLAVRAHWLSSAFAEAVPGSSVDPVDGGLTLWMHVPVDGEEFVDWAAGRGVSLLPGSACRADAAPTQHVRVCFDRPLDVLEQAIDRLS